MRIIANELKKMWNVKILAIIVVLSTLYFFGSLVDWINFYPRGTWFFNVDFAHHLTENYGATLEQDEFEDFLNYREVIVPQLDKFISSNQLFANAGIFSYSDYQDFRLDFGLRYNELDEEERSLWYAIMLEWGNTIRTSAGEMLVSDNVAPEAYIKMINFDNVVGLYRANIIGDTDWGSNIDSFIENTQLNEYEIQRLTEIRDSGELLNIMVWHTTYHTLRYAQNLAALVILITLILVSPLITTDRANRVNWLQYSSKQGRGILKKQFIAVLISAVGMTTILVIVFAGAFSTTGVQAFWNNGINSFMSGTFHWLSITFGEYVLLMIGIIYLLSIGTAAFAFILSRLSQNMIKLIFKVIPLFVAALMLSSYLLRDFLVIKIGGNVLAQIFSLIVFLIAGMVIAALVLNKEKRVELA